MAGTRNREYRKPAARIASRTVALACLLAGASLAADSTPNPLTVHASATEVRLQWFERKPVMVERALPNGEFQMLGIAPEGEFTDPVLDRHQTYIYRATSVLEPRTSSSVTVGPPPAGFNTAALNPVQMGNFQNFGQFPSMILDRNGDPMLAYVWVNPSGNLNLNSSDTSIYFVSWNRSASSFNPPVKVAVTGDISAWSVFFDDAYPLALARDESNNTLGIAYRSYSANGGTAYVNIAMSSDEGQTWTSQVVASVPETTDYSSIDLALSGGAVYLMYYEGSNGPAELVTGTETTAAGAWSSQHSPQVSGYPGVVNQYSIAVDSNGVPAVAFTRVPTGQSGPYPTYFWRPIANTLVEVLTDNGYGYNSYSNVNPYAVRLIFSGVEPLILYGGARTANPNQNQYEWLAYSPTGADGTWTVTNVPANGGATNGDFIAAPFGIAIGSLGQIAVVSTAGGGPGLGCGNKSDTNLATTTNLPTWSICDLGGANGPVITSTQPVVRYGVDDALFVAFTEPDAGEALPQSLQLWAQYSNGRCSYSLASNAQTIGPAAATGSFVLNAGSGCSWVDSSQASWLTITSAESGSGTATVTFSAAANTSGPRVGTLTVAGIAYTVTQNGNGTPVAFFSAASLGFAGQTGTMPLTVSNTSQANLVLETATPSGSAFSISQISCTNGASSLPSIVPPAGACTFSISYAAPPSGTPTGSIVFNDSAPLSNLTSTASGSSFTQSIPLSASGASTPPPTASVSVSETIRTADTPTAAAIPPLNAQETITVVDMPVVAAIPPLTTIGAPLAYFSAGSLGFGGQSGTLPLTVSNLGKLSLSLVSATPSGSAFGIVQTVCTGGASALPAALPPGGACIFTVSYAASSGPAAGAIQFTDNAPLSNLTDTAGGGQFTQSIALNSTGSGTAPPNAPTTVSVSVNEAVRTTDSEFVIIPATNPACDVTQSATVSVADVRTILNQALGISPATADLSGDGVVNVLDTQFVSNAVLGKGCWGH